MLLLSCLLLITTYQSDSDNQVTFPPVTPGNQIPAGPFNYEIPDGVYYTGEDNVQFLFKLAGAEWVPNAYGVFYSSAGTWDWSVMVQWVPGNYVLLPKVSNEVLESYFSDKHIYTQEEVDESPTTIIPATYDGKSGSFTMGLFYPPHETDGEAHVHDYVFVKKVWPSEQGALVFSVRAKKAAFDDDFGLINDVLNSVERDTPYDPRSTSEMATPPATFLTLLGVNIETTEAPEETGTRRMLFYSLGLLLVAGVVLFMAMQLRKDKTAE